MCMRGLETNNTYSGQFKMNCYIYIYGHITKHIGFSVYIFFKQTPPVKKFITNEIIKYKINKIQNK